jgi:hypothetical protein
MKMAVVWNVPPLNLIEVYRSFVVLTASIIALMMEAGSASETPPIFTRLCCAVSLKRLILFLDKTLVNN